MPFPYLLYFKLACWYSALPLVMIAVISSLKWLEDRFWYSKKCRFVAVIEASQHRLFWLFVCLLQHVYNDYTSISLVKESQVLQLAQLSPKVIASVFFSDAGVSVDHTKRCTVTFQIFFFLYCSDMETIKKECEPNFS